MPNVIPAPIPPATATTPGIVSTTTQALGAGQKQFAQPGINIPSIVLPGGAGGFGYGGGLEIGGPFNALQCDGLGFYLQSYGTVNPAEVRSFQTFAIVSGRMEGTIASGEIAVKIGTRRPDANVNATAKLLSLRSGIGGTEIERVFFTNAGNLTMGSGVIGPSTYFGTTQGWVVTNDSIAVIQNGTIFSGLTYGIRVGSTNGIQIDSGLGAGSTDVAVKIGSAVADGSIHASAKLFSVRTGIGGTEVERLALRTGGLTPGFVLEAPGTSASLQMNNSAGTVLVWNSHGLYVSSGVAEVVGFSVPSQLRGSSSIARLVSNLGSVTGDVVTGAGSTTADGSVHANAHLFSVRTGIGGTEVEKFWINKLGPAMSLNSQFAMNGDGGGIFLTYRSGDGMAGFSNGAAAYLGIFPGTGASACSGGFTANGGFVAAAGTTLAVGTTITDLSGTPGAATINAGKGRAALANAATSVVITNSLVDANSVVLIEWEDDPGQRHRVTVAAGSFTVTLSAAAAANVKFRFFVVK